MSPPASIQRRSRGETAWLREQARALRHWGHSVRDTARILGVPRSTVSRWDTNGTPAKARKGTASHSAVSRSQIQRHPSTKAKGRSPERRAFYGAHRWHWTAKVADAGRDLLLQNRRELRHTFVWSGPWVGVGFPVLLERHKSKSPAGGPGSLVIRFSLIAKEQETPYELRDRAAAMVGDVLSSVARERRMAFATVRLSDKPHYEGTGEAMAGLAGREFRVTTQDSYGKVWIDWSRPGTREANMAESLAAYLRVDGNLQTLLERLPLLVGSLDKHAEIMRGLLPEAPTGPRQPPPPGPEVG